MPLVIIESPFAGDVDTNIKFARACMRDSLDRGESPFAMHLLYTQEGILNDNVPEERNRGIEAGLAWGKHASKTVVYTIRCSLLSRPRNGQNKRNSGAVIAQERPAKCTSAGVWYDRLWCGRSSL